MHTFWPCTLDVWAWPRGSVDQQDYCIGKAQLYDPGTVGPTPPTPVAPRFRPLFAGVAPALPLTRPCTHCDHRGTQGAPALQGYLSHPGQPTSRVPPAFRPLFGHSHLSRLGLGGAIVPTIEVTLCKADATVHAVTPREPGRAAISHPPLDLGGGV